MSMSFSTRQRRELAAFIAGLSRPVMRCIASLGTLAVIAACTANPPILEEPLGGSPDDGSQLSNPFRINYAGYLPLQDKIAVYLSDADYAIRSEEHTSELQSRGHLVC